MHMQLCNFVCDGPNIVTYYITLYMYFIFNFRIFYQWYYVGQLPAWLTTYLATKAGWSAGGRSWARISVLRRLYTNASLNTAQKAITLAIRNIIVRIVTAPKTFYNKRSGFYSIMFLMKMRLKHKWIGRYCTLLLL